MCLGWKFPSSRAWHKGSHDDSWFGNTRNTSKRVGNSCKDRKAGWLEFNPVGIHGALRQNSCLRAIPLAGEACGGGCISPPVCLLLEEGLTFLGTSSVLEWAEWPSRYATKPPSQLKICTRAQWMDWGAKDVGEALTAPATSDLQMSLASFIVHLLPLLTVAPYLTFFLHTMLTLSGSAKLRERERMSERDQTTWTASWETCMQVRKQQLELDMEQQTGSK